MRVFILLLLMLPFSLNSQTEYFPSENIADCAGAAEIMHQGSYAVQFTGNSGLVEDFLAYPELKEFKEKNTLYFKFTAPYDGTFGLDATISSGFTQLFVFKGQSGNIVEEIMNGKAELIREIKYPTTSKVGLSPEAETDQLPSIDLKMDEIIIIAFNTSKKHDKILKLSVNYDLKKDVENADLYKKVVDERKDEEKATFYIQVRDSETGNPVIASVNIKDKRRSSLYSGSDLYFNAEKYTKLTIKCDAPGYFFLDKNITIYADSSRELLINMKPVSKGKILKIDKLEFTRATADIIPGTEMILTRVKDFLLLNAELNIEIHGHVNNEGNDNANSRKLSKKRARKIMRYFIQSGVDRKRLSYKAFGNKHPIYVNPQNEREEQANRRVEIKIL